MKKKVLCILLGLILLVGVSVTVVVLVGKKDEGHTHTFTNYVYNDNASCDGYGTKTAKCDFCDQTNTVEDEQNGKPLGHSYGQLHELVNATCEQDGNLSYYQCERCNLYFNNLKTQIFEIKIEKLGHDLQTHQAVQATCSTVGCEEYVTCSRCDYTTYNPIVVDHTEVVDTGYQATCISMGLTDGKHCEVCGKVLVEQQSIPTIAHDLQHYEGVNADCTNAGYKPYDKCKNCAYSTYEEILPLGHNYSEQFTQDVAPTCTNSGIESRHCTVDGCNSVIEEREVKALGHDTQETIDLQATCYQQGSKTVTCKRDDCDYSTVVVTDKLEHNLSAVADCVNDQICTLCNQVMKQRLGHNYSQTVTLPTCESKGYTTFTCDRCNDNYNANYTAELGHQVEDTDYVLISTLTDELCECKKTNIFNATCKNCGTTIEKTVKFEDHTYKAEIDVNATCQAEGQKKFTCTKCNNSYYEKYSDKNAHSWVVKDEENGLYECNNDNCTASKTVLVTTGKQATVSETQLKNADEVSVNGATLNMDSDTKKGLGNGDISINVDTLSEEQKKSALDKSNLTAEQKANVGEIYDFVVENSNGVVSKFDGSVTVTLKYKLQPGDDVDNIAVYYINDDGKLESFTAVYSNGYVTFTTGHFSKYMVTRLTPKERCKRYGHKESVNKLEPTCVKDGYIIIVCIRCGEEVENEHSKALGHNYEKTTTNATCTEDGCNAYKCSRCDSNYQEVIKAIGHDYKVVESKQSTCYFVGYEKYACENCSKEYIRNFAQLEHDFSMQTTQPTCTATGLNTYTCKNQGCNYSYTEVVNALGHKLKEQITQATCTTPETITNVCERCDFSSVTFVGEQLLPHEYKLIYADENSCTQGGKKVYECESCKKQYEEVILPLGHQFKITIVEPDCTNEGYTLSECTVCDYSQKTNIKNALGHNYETTVIDQTCVQRGYTLNKCSHCGDSFESNDLGYGDHKYEIQTVSPTCTEQGYTIGKCSVCDEYSEKYNIVDALGHVGTDVCERCNANLNENEFYVNLLNSIVDQKYTIKLENFTVATSEFTGLDQNGKEIYNTLDQISIKFAELYIDIDENLKINGYGSAQIINYARMFGEQLSQCPINAKAVIKNDILYLFMNQTDIASVNSNFGSRAKYFNEIDAYAYVKMDFALQSMFNNDFPQQVIPLIKQAIGLCKNELLELYKNVVNKNEWASSLFGSVVENLFTKQEVQDGNLFTFDFNKLCAINDRLYNDDIQTLFGEENYANLQKEVLSLLDLTIGKAVEKLKDNGIDIYKVKDIIDKTLVAVMGEGATIEQAIGLDTTISQLIEKYKDYTVDTILTNAFKLEKGQLKQRVDKVFADLKQSTLYDVAFEIISSALLGEKKQPTTEQFNTQNEQSENEFTKEQLYKYVDEFLKSLGDMGVGFSFATKTNGELQNASLNMAIAIPNGSHTTISEILINGKVQLIANYTSTENYDQLIAKVESYNEKVVIDETAINNLAKLYNFTNVVFDYDQNNKLIGFTYENNHSFARYTKEYALFSANAGYVHICEYVTSDKFYVDLSKINGVMYSEDCTNWIYVNVIANLKPSNEKYYYYSIYGHYIDFENLNDNSENPVYYDEPYDVEKFFTENFAGQEIRIEVREYDNSKIYDFETVVFLYNYVTKEYALAESYSINSECSKHQYEIDESLSKQAQGCDGVGEVRYVCSTCGYQYVLYFINGHGELQTTYKFIDENIKDCENGYYEIKTCTICNKIIETYEGNWHNRMIEDQYDLTEYGVDGSIVVNKCLCGKDYNVQLNVKDYNYQDYYFTEDNKAHSQYKYTFIENENLVFIHDKMIVYENCIGYSVYSYLLTYGDEVLFDYEYENKNTTYEGHNYNAQITLNKDQTYSVTFTCDNCNNQIINDYNKPNIQLAYLTQNERYDGYVYLFDCVAKEDGYYTIQSYSQEDTYVALYCDGKQIDSNDDGKENSNFKLNAFLQAGKTYTYCIRYYDRNDGNPIEFSFEKSTNQTEKVCYSHFNYVDYEFLTQVDCEKGYVFVTYCRYCAEIYEHGFNDAHDTIKKVYVDFGNLNACRDCKQMYFVLCACEQYANSNLNFDYHKEHYNVDYDYYYDENDVYHNTSVSACNNCGVVVKKDNYYGERIGCYEYYYSEYEITFGKQVVYNEKFVNNVNAYHNYKYQFTLNGQSCEDGYQLTGVCTACGYEYTDVGYDHQTYEIKYYASDFGGCEDSCVSVYTCACGQNKSVNYANLCGSSNYNSYKDENGVAHNTQVKTCDDCNLVYSIDYYKSYDRENCEEVTYYTVILSVNNTTVFKLNYTTCDTKHDIIITAQFEDGNTSCEQGFYAIYTCKVCGYNYDQYYNYHNTIFAYQTIDLSNYGCECGGSATLYKCACEKFKDLRLDIDCDVKNDSIALEQIVGTNAYNNLVSGYSSYNDNFTEKYFNYYYNKNTCYVTQPQCGFSYAYATYYLQDESKCLAVEYTTYLFGLDQNNNYQNKLTFKTGYSYVRHNPKNVTKTYENITIGGKQATVTALTCGNCGSYDMKFTLNDYPNYPYYLQQVRYSYNDKGEKQSYQYVYTYDFSDCSYVRKETNIDGSISESDGYDHQYVYSYSTITEPTCLQYGLQMIKQVCKVCNDTTSTKSEISPTGHHTSNSYNVTKEPTCTQSGKIIITEKCSSCDYSNSVQQDIMPTDHYFVYNKQKQIFVCMVCGLENTNGVSGQIIMQDMTDYDNGTDYVVGYYNETNVKFTYYVVLLINNPKDGEDDQVILTNLTINSCTDINGYYFSKAEVESLATALGYNKGDYVVAFTFVPNYADGNYDYTLTFEKTNVNYLKPTISNEGVYTVYLASKRQYIYTFIAKQNGTYTFTSFTEREIRLEVFDKNNNELNDYNYLYSNDVATATLKAGETYRIIVEYAYDYDFQGYVSFEIKMKNYN